MISLLGVIVAIHTPLGSIATAVNASDRVEVRIKADVKDNEHSIVSGIRNDVLCSMI
jgi:hypothetical protein